MTQEAVAGPSRPEIHIASPELAEELKGLPFNAANISDENNSTFQLVVDGEIRQEHKLSPNFARYTSYYLDFMAQDQGDPSVYQDVPAENIMSEILRKAARTIYDEWHVGQAMKSVFQQYPLLSAKIIDLEQARILETDIRKGIADNTEGDTSAALSRLHQLQDRRADDAQLITFYRGRYYDALANQLRAQNPDFNPSVLFT